ncbi:MAG: hypothetical protein H6613_00725 [Ignavibacteriales bacterium]|nr:hypothetical protein [Ignavibacteriales bacterium]
MNIFTVEEERQKLLVSLSNEKSPRIILFEICAFSNKVFNLNEQNIHAAFIPEFIKDIKIALENFTAFGIKLQLSKNLIHIVEKVLPFANPEDTTSIKINLQRIKNEIGILNNILSGNFNFNDENGIISFPVIEQTENVNYDNGLLEELIISFGGTKNKNKTEFILSPSLPNIDEKLYNQLNNSWQFAVNFLSTITKRKIPHFDVYVRFKNKFGIYEGNSLGTALTIGFIQQLIIYFDLLEICKIKSSILTTGSVNEQGDIFSVSKNIIEQKTKVAFYSNTQKFVVAEADKIFAKNIVKQEQKKYPNRNLEIIGVSNLNEIFNRRDIIEIKKQNPISWGSKKVLKNKIAVTSLAALLTILGFIYFDKDVNPVSVEIVKDAFLVKNSKNEILWKKETVLLEAQQYGFAPYNFYRILDVDNDGKNEVIFVHLNNYKSLALFNYKGELKWDYNHKDSVETSYEKFIGNFYFNGIIDTVHSDNKIAILAYCQHQNYYPNGILKIDCKTGKPFGDILWHPGGITGAVLHDLNNDGKKKRNCSKRNF